MTFAIVQLLAGLVILTVGGHYIVRGAAALALLANVSTAVVGLTVVAFGTSLPEMAVSVQAAVAGSTELAYANVVGSSIFNLAVILGVVAMVRPVLVQAESKQFEYPGMFVVLAACVVLARDGVVTRWDGALFLVGFVVFLWVTVRRNLRGPESEQAERMAQKEAGPPTGWNAAIGFVVIGIVGLWAGAEFLVDGATTIAQTFGVSERLIGLTLVAMGTSIPELATSIVAARRGEDEIALSNLMGSNIFNILAVLGTTASLVPVPVNARAIALDNWVMLGSAAVLFPILWTSPRVMRWHGALLLMGFIGYFAVLVSIG